MNVSYVELQQSFKKLILSASGWRKVFAQSGNEADRTSQVASVDRDIAFLAAQSFAEFLQAEFSAIHTVVIARDGRPTGAALQEEALLAFSLISCKFTVQSIGIAAAPEIMAYARSIGAAFMYISASHNPIGHNGFKFGLDTGGVLNGAQSTQLIALFTKKCSAISKSDAVLLRQQTDGAKVTAVYDTEKANKMSSLAAYQRFLREVIADSRDNGVQNTFFDRMRSQCTVFEKNGKPFTLIADFNGSARAASVDRLFFEQQGMKLIGISEEAGAIAHGIVPEGDNLKICANALENLHRSDPVQAENTLLGYMPDCDGDRGNIIYWDEAQKKALPLEAQEVFALSVIAELSYLHFSGKTDKPLAVAVNGPTSLRINEIASAFNAEVFYAEVGEANVVNRAEDLRKYGYEVRIFGEGSNGGNITYPAAVRDPLNTLFAIGKLLLIRDTADTPCPFHIWCEKSGQTARYQEDFTLTDIIETLPQYRSTPLQTDRALMHIHTNNHAALKSTYQEIFMREWADKKAFLKERFGIAACKIFSYNGTVGTENPGDFGLSGKGGLKVQFYSAKCKPIAFIWMRGSGTEPVFRVMADIKGSDTSAEEYLVNWQRAMVCEADAAVSGRN